MSAHDGGPAFPINDLSVNNATGEAIQHQYVEPGMSLRDYFAAKVLAQCLEFAFSEQAWMHGGDWRDGVALDAYKMADAMLRAREAK